MIIGVITENPSTATSAGSRTTTPKLRQLGTAIARTAAIKIGNSILFHAAKADIGLKIEYPDENIRFIIRELAHIAVKKATKKIKINAPLAIATSIGDIV